MRRREFLRRSASSLAGLAVLPQSFAGLARSFKRSQHVVIIGAGLAGLTCARALRALGHEVDVLEAKERPGGRVLTLREPFSDGLIAEAGAARIHDTDVLVLQYVREFGLDLTHFYPDSLNDVIDIGGQRKLLAEIGEAQFESSGLLSMNANRIGNLLSDRRSNRPLLKVVGGNDRLPYEMAESLRGQIQYGSPVVHIERSEEQVRVTTAVGPRHVTLTADRVVCAVPFPVLRRIQVSPDWSEGKARSIGQARYISGFRYFFQTRSRSWERRGETGFGVTELGEVWNQSHDVAGTRSIVSFYANRVPQLIPSTEGRRTISLAHTSRIIPDLEEDLEATAVKVWDDDPWAAGAGLLPTSLAGYEAEASGPEGRVHFAGEHVSSRPLWMEGAIESGLRVAREIDQA